LQAELQAEKGKSQKQKEESDAVKAEKTSLLKRVQDKEASEHELEANIASLKAQVDFLKKAQSDSHK